MRTHLHHFVEAVEKRTILLRDSAKDHERLFQLGKGMVVTAAKSGACFWLGEFDDWRTRKVVPELVKLPFPVCWFECEATQPDGEKALFAIYIDAVDSADALLCGFFSKAKQGMAFYDVGKILSPETTGKEEWSFICDETRTNEEYRERNWKFMMSLAFVALCAISAINCVNVAKVEHQPPQKLQQARARRGKLPLFSTYTLELDGRHEATKLSLGGSHSPPRFHLRRGHPRQYRPAKWCWVQAHAVGHRERGVIEKEYALA